jgi:hypothetical protein
MLKQIGTLPLMSRIEKWELGILLETVLGGWWLLLCRNRGFLYIVLEGDSSIVVNAINKGGLRWSIYGQILADIQGLVVCFHSWSMCHTRRGANNAAHFLAKEGLKYATTRNWVKCVPDCIAQVVFTVYRDQFSGHLELLGF